MMMESLNDFYTKAYINRITTSENLLDYPCEKFRKFIGQGNINLEKEKWALDMGYGYGNYSLYLASKRYKVDSIDLVSPYIFQKRIDNEYKELKRKIQIICDDLNHYDISKKYSVIFSRNTLHYLEYDQIKRIILQAKRNTEKGGKNYFEIFSDIKRNGKVDINLRDQKITSSEELIDYISNVYYDWKFDIEIENYEEKTEGYVFEAKKIIFEGVN